MINGRTTTQLRELLPFWVILIAVARLSAADFYVSPSGDDSNPGTKGRPFASLERARDAVRAVRQVKPERDYTVFLRGGVYRLKETVVFSLQDSAAEGHTITYAAYPKETPIFSSGVPINGWKKEGKLWIANLPATMKPFRTLYYRQGRLPRARSAPFSPTQDYKTADKLDRFTLPFPKGALKNWPNPADVEIVIRPNYGWVLNVLPLESVDEEAGMARTSVPVSYPMVKVRWGLSDVNAKGTVWVENVLEALDEPGEWVLNTKEHKSFLWPREVNETLRNPGIRQTSAHQGEGRAGVPEGIEAPQLTELIRVEGKIDYDGPRDEPVRGLVFHGLSFTCADRWPWEKDRLGLTLQHDWEMFDRPTAMVRLRGAERIVFENCRWFESGGAAIRMDLHAQSNRVADSVIEKIGGAGIVLSGYGPGIKNVNRRNEITRNHIHDVGGILWQSGAISVWQSGENHIAYNLIHDTPYTAITVSGRIFWNKENKTGRGDGWRTIRWEEVERAGGDQVMPMAERPVSWRLREPFLLGRNNLVERNEIHDVMQKLWDGDAIYVSGTGRSNWIRENFIHDCLSENMCEGIRCDDDQHETIIERNVILRNGGMGTGIAIKGKNYILNNFIVDPVGTFNPRGVISLEGVPLDGSIIQRNILFLQKPDQRPFYLKNTIGPPDPKLSETKTDFNLFYCATDANWANAHLSTARAEGQELHSMIGDPLFQNPDKGDFRFKSGSPAPKLGVEPIDLRKAGLRGIAQ